MKRLKKERMKKKERKEGRKKERKGKRTVMWCGVCGLDEAFDLERNNESNYGKNENVQLTPTDLPIWPCLSVRYGSAADLGSLHTPRYCLTPKT